MTQFAEASTLDPTSGRRACYTLDISPDGDTVTCIYEGRSSALVLNGPAGTGPSMFTDLMTRLEEQGYLVAVR